MFGKIFGCIRKISTYSVFRNNNISYCRNYYIASYKWMLYSNFRTHCFERNFDIVKYEEICNETLESLAEYFEEILSETKYPESDISFSSGVLTIHLNDEQGTYVINRQTPNKQIWLSSPISGPKRYDWTGEEWIYKRDGVSLHKLLSKEMSELLEMPIDFSKCSHGKPKRKS